MGYSEFFKKSQDAHFNLGCKALDKKDILKWHYHDAVYEAQKKANKVLSNDERQKIYKKIYRL